MTTSPTAAAVAAVAAAVALAATLFAPLHIGTKSSPGSGAASARIHVQFVSVAMEQHLIHTSRADGSDIHGWSRGERPFDRRTREEKELDAGKKHNGPSPAIVE